jgi:hypothetical protein
MCSRYSASRAFDKLTIGHERVAVPVRWSHHRRRRRKYVDAGTTIVVSQRTRCEGPAPYHSGELVWDRAPRRTMLLCTSQGGPEVTIDLDLKASETRYVEASVDDVITTQSRPTYAASADSPSTADGRRAS